MSVQSTSREKISNDKASNIIYKRGFGSMVASALEEFGLNLVHGTKAIGPSGHADDWPVCMIKRNPEMCVYHIDAPCFEIGVANMGTRIEDSSYFDAREHSYRNLRVPPHFHIRGKQHLKFQIGDDYAFSFSIDEQRTRCAMDKASARVLARDLAIKYIDYLSCWVQYRGRARDVLDGERDRREQIGKHGQGGFWFAGLSRDGYEVSWGSCKGGGGDSNYQARRDRESVFLTKNSHLDGKGLSLDQAKRLKEALRETDTLFTIDDDVIDDEMRFNSNDCKWQKGLPLNLEAGNHELKLAWAHRLMRVDVPKILTIPGKFRRVKAHLAVRNTKGRWEAERGLPWTPLDPETIAEL
tara:strand:+ start:5772 stop:6833 length:1062 start_codon:yes stop_codon:yes gene_type:complete